MHLSLLLFTVGAACLPPQSAQPPVAWEPVVVQRAWSLGKSQLDADGAVVSVEGQPAPDDVHFVDVDVGQSGITGFKLEAMGPGKGRQGLFRLSEFGVSSYHPNRPTRMKPVILVHAAGSSPKPKHPVYLAIDNNTRSAWHGTKRHGTAFFECASPVELRKSERLRFTFEYLGRGRDTLGAFRLSVTTDPQPLRGVGHPLTDGWASTQERINAAIDRGVRRVLEQQERDGSWKQHQDRHVVGQTALSLFTLIKAGVPRSDEAVRRALAFIRAHPADTTYGLSSVIMALCAMDPEEHRDEIEEGVEQLISWHRGGYAYPEGTVDLSNTQYAALALRSAVIDAGVKVPRDLWSDLIKVTLRHQERAPSGLTGGATIPLGFKYRPSWDTTGSMTTAGVTLLAICHEQLKKPTDASKVALDRGLAWLARHYSQTHNPLAREPHQHHPAVGKFHYYLYGLERVGSILDQNLFGPHDWYRKGAIYLLDSQQDNGGFGGQQPSTCFGTLFLVRATRPAVMGPVTRAASSNLSKTWGEDRPGAPVSIRAGGTAPLTFWVSSYGTKTHKSYEWPGEEGSGPRVAEARYFIARPTARNKKQLVATVKGDLREPVRGRNLAAQHLFEEFGRWVLTAEVMVSKPGQAGELATLKAPAVEVLVRDPDQEMGPGELYGYALDPLNNLTLDADVEATASSHRGSWEPSRAVDNLQASGWLSEDGDKDPWLSLKFGNAPRANRILIGQVHDFTQPGAPSTTSFRKVRLEVNGKRREVDMLEDPRRKTVVNLARTTRIRTLKLWILDPVRQRVGFSEVELQLHKKGQR